jgi:5-methyltetrahydrofolate--homocysteine methyltransferase
MPLVVQELHRRGLKIPVLVGGAAINRKFGRRILFAEEGVPYTPGVFYCKDAFEGLGSMDKLQSPERGEFVKRIIVEAEEEVGRRQTAGGKPAIGVKSEVANRRPQIPTPPVWGPRLIDKMPLEFVFECVDKDELFRLSWGATAKRAHGAEWEKLKAEFEARLVAMRSEAVLHQWFAPRAVYGCWPAQSDGNDLIVYEPQSAMNGARAKELVRFTFPRQDGQDHLCLADYFAPVDSGLMDVVAFQVVTVGPRATEMFDAMQARNEYSEAYFFHGLAVQTAEATAEYVHRHLRRELNIAPGRGKRYSWGYPAIPDLDHHRQVFQLLPAEKELGMSLSPAYQLIPEQSTAAIFVHHPEARYYTVGGSRLEQLEREMAKG